MPKNRPRYLYYVTSTHLETGTVYQTLHTDEHDAQYWFDDRRATYERHASPITMTLVRRATANGREKVLATY